MGPDAVNVQTFDVTAIHHKIVRRKAIFFLHNRKVKNDTGVATFPFASCLGAALASAAQQFHKIHAGVVE